MFFSLLIITAKIYFPALTPSNLYNGGKNFSDIASALLKGTCVGCYWYIPFVTVLFVFSPLFCRLKNTAFLQCLFFAAAVSAILPIRGSWTNCLTAVNLYTYFTFAYLFGIAFARYRKEMQPFFKQICFTALLLGIGLIYIINNKTFPFVTAHATFLHAIQKYFFTIVVLTLLEQFKHKYNYLLDQLAVYSFSIFFLHMIFEYDYWKTYTYISNKIPAMTEAKIFDSWQLVLFYITGGFCYLLLMLGISILLKKCIGKHSRYFIGS